MGVCPPCTNLTGAAVRHIDGCRFCKMFTDPGVVWQQCATGPVCPMLLYVVSRMSLQKNISPCQNIMSILKKDLKNLTNYLSKFKSIKAESNTADRQNFARSKMKASDLKRKFLHCTFSLSPPHDKGEQFTHATISIIFSFNFLWVLGVLNLCMEQNFSDTIYLLVIHCS